MKKYLFSLSLVLIAQMAMSAVSTVSGTITNGEGLKLYFEKYVETGLAKLDSTVLTKSGKFSFKVTDDQTNYYRISTKPTDFVVAIVKPGEKITINAKGNDLNRSYTIKGSTYSAQLKEFSDLVNRYVITRDTISARFKRAIAAEKT